MTNLEYHGSLVDDIKLIKKNNKKREKKIFKMELCYLVFLSAYLIYIFFRVANGLGTIPSLNLFVNILIITRSCLSIKHTNAKRKKDYAVSRVRYLANKILNKKNLDNNISGHLNIDNFEKSVIIEEKEDIKKYDENDDLYDYIDIVNNYIYLLDSENELNVLKEVRRELNKDGITTTESSLELLDREDLPEELPVKQVLKLRKDN